MKEEDFFKVMHEQLSLEYPRFCSCGIIHTDERDYNARTEEVQGHGDYTKLGLGRVFHRNCPMPCGSTLTKIIAFDDETENKFFDYVGNRKRREHKGASEIVEKFRQEYNTWLASLPKLEKGLVLGVGCELIDNIFNPMNNKQIFYLNANALSRSDADEVEKAKEILQKNQNRIDLIAIQTNPVKRESHKKLIETIRKYDQKLKRHTTVLAIGEHHELREGYKNLDLNGFIPDNTEIQTIRDIAKLYLPYVD